MPRDVGDVGFPIELHPRDPDTAWVFPMDGTDVWPRTSHDEQGRIRRHMRVFLNGETADDLDSAIAETDEVVIMQALSGG